MSGIGPVIVIVMGCFLVWGSVSIIRRGYFVGRVPLDEAQSGRWSRRYYRAGHPLQFWSLSIGSMVMGIVLIAWALSRLSRG